MDNTLREHLKCVHLIFKPDGTISIRNHAVIYGFNCNSTESGESSNHRSKIAVLKPSRKHVAVPSAPSSNIRKSRHEINHKNFLNRFKATIRDMPPVDNSLECNIPVKTCRVDLLAYSNPANETPAHSTT